MQITRKVEVRRNKIYVIYDTPFEIDFGWQHSSDGFFIIISVEGNFLERVQVSLPLHGSGNTLDIEIYRVKNKLELFEQDLDKIDKAIEKAIKEYESLVVEFRKFSKEIVV